MNKDLSRATEKNLLRAAQIEERTTDTIHQLEQNLQNKKIALLSFLTATLFGWLGLALGSGGLSVLQWMALLVVLIGGFGPGLVAVFSPTEERELRLKRDVVFDSSRDLAEFRWTVATEERFLADKRLKKDAKSFWRWVQIAIPSICLTIILFTAGTLTKGNSNGEIQNQGEAAVLSRESS